MISIVVITADRTTSLKQCINSLFNQSYKNYEIIIIDNGSMPTTQQFIKRLEHIKTIKYIQQKSKGRGAARNLGLKKSKGSIISFTDDDCIPPLNWLESLNNCFKIHSEVAAVGGAIINADKNPFGEAAYILNFSAWFPQGKKRYLKDIPTANIAYKRESIKGIKFPVRHKDLDYEDSFFNFSIINERKKILFDPSINVLHNPKIDCYERFLKNQQRKALSFLLRGYKLHGLAGKMLIKFKFLNLFCPRLLLVFLRCFKSSRCLYKFIIYFPFIFRGELERGLTIAFKGEKNI